MNEQEIKDLIKLVIKENEKNKDLENDKEQINYEIDYKIHREVNLNNYMNTGQEIYKIIITLSSGAIGLLFSFINSQNLKEHKILLILGLFAFLFSIICSLFTLILNKKDLIDRWHKRESLTLEYFINILGNCGIWLFIIGILMITIIAFNKI